jgi:lysyl-tRNA synthetase class 1
MGTSKGTGAAAHEMADLLPPDLLRFLFLRQKPRRAIDFDPEGDAIPGLFDEFDRVAAATAGLPVRGELPPDPERIFAVSLVDADADPAVEAARYRPPFRHLAMLVQVPGVDVEARLAAEKGAPLDDEERRIVTERIRIARAWLETLAPDRYRVQVRRELPREAASLTAPQRDYLAVLASAAVRENPDNGDAWQDLIYRSAQGAGLSSADAFSAVYRAFLGRTNGPRAGWLLASLDPEFVVSRLRDAALTPPAAVAEGVA